MAFNLQKHVSREFETIAWNAKELANKLEHKEVSTLHVLYALAEKDKRLNIKQRHEIITNIIKLFNRHYKTSSNSDIKASSELLEAFNNARKHVRLGGFLSQKQIQSSHFIKELQLDDKYYAHGIAIDLYGPIIKHHQDMKIEFSENIQKYTINLCNLARKGEYNDIIDRPLEVKKLIQVLCRKHKNNPLIMGDSGIGKTSIVYNLTKLFISGAVPNILKSKHLLKLEIPALMAGTAHRGELEEKCKDLFKDLDLYAQQIVLFIDDINLILKTDKNNDISGLLKPILSKSSIQCIGSITTEYKKLFDNHPDLERLFQIINLNETSFEETLHIIQGLKPNLEKHHEIEINESSLNSAIKLSSRYIQNRKMPDKVIDLLDETAAFIKSENKNVVNLTDQDIANTITRWTGIPVGNMFADEHTKVLKLKEGLLSRVAGQNEAIEAIYNVMKKAQAGLSDPNKPLGVFLFLGSSGTGKTETAKALAQFQFDSESNLIRIDMSEYGEKHTVSKLIGSPPGYEGSSDGGILTEAVKNKPYSVVLFDEIEKAHSDVYNIFLQIFDEGRLTDSKGRLTNFKNTVIILTSNIGSHHIVETQDPHKLKELINTSLRSHFRPELLNRIDSIITFSPLKKEVMTSILDIQLINLYKRLKERDITLSFTQKAKEWIADKGYNPEYGARPLKRTIESEIVEPLSDAILSGKYPRGSTILCDLKEDQLIYKLQ